MFTNNEVIIIDDAEDVSPPRVNILQNILLGRTEWMPERYRGVIDKRVGGADGEVPAATVAEQKEPVFVPERTGAFEEAKEEPFRGEAEVADGVSSEASEEMESAPRRTPSDDEENSSASEETAASSDKQTQASSLWSLPLTPEVCLSTPSSTVESSGLRSPSPVLGGRDFTRKRRRVVRVRTLSQCVNAARELWAKLRKFEEAEKVLLEDDESAMAVESRAREELATAEVELAIAQERVRVAREEEERARNTRAIAREKLSAFQKQIQDLRDAIGGSG